jgi:predicted helicase
VMMAPYAMGHLKLHLALAEEGFPLPEDAGFPSYLTNALDRRELAQSRLPFARILSREAQVAAGIKRGETVNVVLGNPPYSGRSWNRFPPAEDEVERWLKEGFATPGGGFSEGYYRVDGRPLGERNPKWLQDDYVRFLRFAQWKIEQAGQGIVAFVTNHSYLDNPTFRGLRRSLLETFDELYFLDLHGARKKGEAAPGGGRDENVFDIEQGVAIALLVKAPGLPRRVFHADLYGRQREKRDWLAEHERATTGWSELAPRAPAYLFVPAAQAEDAGEEEAYGRWPALPAIFPVHSAGVVTARDDFLLDFDRQLLKARVIRLRVPAGETNGWAGGLRDTGSFRAEDARRELLADEDWYDRFLTILYRPFDERWIFYADYLVERPRRAVMGHMLRGPNLGLVCPKQHKEEPGALVTDTLAGHKAVSAYDINDLFPLYLYPEPGPRASPELPLGAPARRANVAPALVAALAAAHGAEPAPEEVLGHVYAVLYSPPYRRRYRALLRRGFPHIPFPRRRDLFAATAALGAELIDLHRLPPRLPEPPEVRFEGKGSGMVGEAKRAARDYRPAEGRVYVNADRQRFEGIAPEVWDYRIGGHQVLDRWLASRAGRLLTRADIEGFAAAAAAIERTLAIERRLAEVYPEIEAGELVSVDEA